MAVLTTIEFSDDVYELACASAGTGNNVVMKTVLIDGDENNNSFTLVISEDWIVCRRERNKLYISVKRNYGEDERIGYLNVTSTLDNRATATLEITQEGDVFGIEVDETSLVLSPKNIISSPVINYDGINSITITCSTPEAIIYYRLNGEGNFLRYSSAKTINEDTLIEAFSKFNDSDGDKTSQTVSLKCVYGNNISAHTNEIVSEVEKVSVTVTGGRGRFGIKRIDKYVLVEEEIDSSDDSSEDGSFEYIETRVDYDYGLKVEKNDDSINVINYGKVPIEENFDHYEIILYHLDKPEITVSIMVTYQSDVIDISWECGDSVTLPATSGVEMVSVIAKNNNENADWSISSVVTEGGEWVKCTAASNALILEYGEAEIGNTTYRATITLNCYSSSQVINVTRDTDVIINTPQPIPPHERLESYPTGIIVLDEISENVYVETPVEETVSLVVPWDVGEFDVPLLTRFYEDKYTPFPTYDSNILINNRSRWMGTSLSSKYGEVYSEPTDGEEQLSYGEVQIKVLTVTVRDNYSSIDRTYAIRLRDAQMPSNTIFLRITQTALDIDSSDDSSDDSSTD